MTSELKVDTISNAAGTSAISIDSSGRIKLSNPIAFHVRGTGTQAWTGSAHEQNLALTSVVENIGNGYSTSTYKFTCPVSGVYLFYGQYTNTVNGSNGPEMYIRNETSNTLIGRAIGYHHSYIAHHAQGVLECNAGDVIECVVINHNGSTVTVDKGRSCFGGYLVA